MYRFINFNDEKADTLLLLELTDLAKTLAGSPSYEVEVRVHSYLSTTSQKVYLSNFWNHRPEQIRNSGLKSDVFLRALGNKSFTDFRAIDMFRNRITGSGLLGFAQQLLMLAEDVRIEELCKKDRPGMRNDFYLRRKTYTDYFESQLTVNLEKNLYTDALYSFIYLTLSSESPLLTIPSLNPEIDAVIPIIRKDVENLYDASSTKDCIDVCVKVLEKAEAVCNSDMVNEYFHLPASDQNLADFIGFSDLLRKDPLQNNDVSDEKASGKEEAQKEEMNMWHRETEDTGKSFLQFELDQGTKTDIEGGNERDGEEGDQALAIVQGQSKRSNKRDYSKLEVSGHEELKTGGMKGKYGKANKNARPIFLTAGKPSHMAQAKYTELEKDVNFYHRKLKNMMERIMEKKETEKRTHLQMGRLGKKLLSFYTDEHPKLFYKKAELGRKIDAAFILLVDCSASMFDKMEEMKRGIILFHEALKSVGVPHEVIGFWEDANEASPGDQPNYFLQAISFSSSLIPQSGPEIMELESMEDNRDGYAIRMMSERLIPRHEKEKFLIVFSDGEPAAFDYDHGIVDTHEAVMEVRKKGIEVFNIFLSNSGMEFEQKKVFENIYGNRSIIAPYVDELPDVLFPLLKKLLSQSISM